MIFFALLATLIAFVLLVAAWPFLWDETITRLINTFTFYSTLGFKDPRVQEIKTTFSLPLGFGATEIVRIASMTQPTMLLFFLIGFIALIFRKVKTKHREGLLVLLWFIIPILRVSRQETETLGSIRNYLEFLPAFAIIAGVGISLLLRKLTSQQVAEEEGFPSARRSGDTRRQSSTDGRESSDRIWNTKYKVILTLTILLYVGILSIPIIKLHPNQNLYFNFLVGGLKGAKNLKLYQWETSYGNLYRQAINWLNESASKKSRVAHLDGTMLSISPLWLRGDFTYGSFFSGYNQGGEYVVSLAYPDPPPVFAYNYLDRFLYPVYTLEINDVPVLKIWQNEKNLLRTGFEKQKQLKQILSPKRYFLDQRKVWDLKLDKKQWVTRLIISVPEENCGNEKGVWSVVLEDKEKFLSLEDFSLDETRREIDFPAEAADIIRFWDVQGNSCLYNAEVESVDFIE